MSTRKQSEENIIIITQLSPTFPRPGREQANNTFTKKKFTLKCLKCNGPHKLMQCKKASDKEKRDLWEKFKHKFGHRKPTPQANATNSSTDRLHSSTIKSCSSQYCHCTTNNETPSIHVADFKEAFTSINIPTKGPKRSVNWASMARVNKHRRSQEDMKARTSPNSHSCLNG